MTNWTRIVENYDGAFTESYLDLYKDNTGFVIQGTSWHYNAAVEKALCEIRIPTALRAAEEILTFIADHSNDYLWADVTPDALRANQRLSTFIQANI